jgi:glycosyltransferase involved in cell wall biosynthesis
MACGCAIVASDTAPLREAIVDQDTGILVDFFNPGQLADSTIKLLEDAKLRQQLGARARAFAVANYDLNSVCLPRMLDLIEHVANSKY